MIRLKARWLRIHDLGEVCLEDLMGEVMHAAIVETKIALRIWEHDTRQQRSHSFSKLYIVLILVSNLSPVYNHIYDSSFTLFMPRLLFPLCM